MKTMKPLRHLYLLPLLTALVWTSAQSRASTPPDQPAELVDSLYTQVVARQPIGLPDMTVFGPYLSEALRHKFDLADACLADWYRQNPDPDLKPPSNLIEDGFFSGPNEEAEPQSFKIEKAETGKTGSSRVDVKLTWQDGTDNALVWKVAVMVIREDSRPSVNDVLFLKDDNSEIDTSLSDNLAAGCDGPHWTGKQ